MFRDVSRSTVAEAPHRTQEADMSSNQRSHHVTTSDGVTIGGTVHGHGPALVFLQGVVGDGDLDWQRALPHLIDKYTCHLPSLRGRGLSGDHPDLSSSRIVEDF